jgi:inner membrane protein
MQKSLIYKFLTIGGLVLLLLVPLAMIGGIVDDRQRHRSTAERDIAESWTGSQKITSAVLVAPYKEKLITAVEVYEEGKRQTVQKERNVQRYKYILPETITINGDIKTEERYRGIYKVPVYTADMKIDGVFHVKKHLGLTQNIEKITWQTPYIVFGVQDIRGINQSVKLNVNDKHIELLPGTRTSFIPQGIHGTLNLDYDKAVDLNFDVALELQGMQSLSFLPMGKSTKVNLTSPWPHPRFQGRYLPKTREVSGDGFAARWETSFFSSNIPQQLKACVELNQCTQFHENIFGVSLNQGVDIYLQVERSVKYALLFVGLTFVAFFLFEVLKGLRIHAVQYGLVGVALALFYLLLISLSEHMAFGLSYIIASIACVSLISFYVSFVLRSATRGVVFAGTLTGLYGALYILIRSEDYALLMGSGLLFGVLAFIMAITRDIDWYKIESGAKQQLIQKDKEAALKPSSLG